MTTGTGTLYSGYHLRYALAANAVMGRVEGVFDLNDEDMGFKGKWWTVVQDTNAYGNEMFFKNSGGAKIVGDYPESFKIGQTHKWTLIAAGVKDVKASDIHFTNRGLAVRKVQRIGSSAFICEVKVAANAASGAFTFTVKGVKADNTLKVFKKIDGIKVLPEIGRARVSCGAAYPPQGVQFVARGISFGPDGKPGTADDLVLDPVQVSWSLAEEKTRANDDDLKWVKAPVVNGLYTPTTTYGPIEARVQRDEGTGLIKIIARYDKLESSALLAVTVPDFITHIK
jgi:quinohemoprotein amine dehydrogenase